MAKLSSAGAKRRRAFPLEVVPSGNITMILCGFCDMTSAKVVGRLEYGFDVGGAKE